MASRLSFLPLAIALTATLAARADRQAPVVQPIDEQRLREYAGVYEWTRDRFLYLQLWDEFSGFGKPRQLVAFDESGDVRTLYATGPDRFFAGPGAAVSSSIESTIAFQRDAAGKITGLTWTRPGSPPASARRRNTERYEDVRFANGPVNLAGTITMPAGGGRHPAIILVHGSGAENRDYVLPWAHFLVRHGVAILGFDKRGVNESSGDWNTASFDDLAGDVVAAFEYLKTRRDLDPRQIGLIGISQAGWVMPLAALRARDLGFLISISGAGVSAAETTIDQARNEMTMTGMPVATVNEIIALLQLQYEFARTGNGWDAYSAARDKLVAKMGRAPDTIPGKPDAPYFQFIRRLYFYEPAPTLRQLRLPTLAIWGELDNNILAGKNKTAWESALNAAGNRDYTLHILSRANHAQFEATVGSNAEMPSLTRITPAYFGAVHDWLAKHLRNFHD